MPSTAETIPTVLAVDDEELVRSLVRRFLEADGYSVVEAASGSEALELAKTHVSSLRLLITDVLMPEMSGTELAERAERLSPRLRVIFMSGYTGETNLKEALQAGSAMFVQKPFSRVALIAAVRAAIGAP